MKQTAVKWLIEKIEDTSHDLHHLMKVRGVFEQAKEMERQQIIDAYHINPLETKWENIGEQYYNETFKQQKP